MTSKSVGFETELKTKTPNGQKIIGKVFEDNQANTLVVIGVMVFHFYKKYCICDETKKFREAE
jgi:hypothetical protein